MEITGGEALGQSIEMPTHPGLRPTSPEMREAYSIFWESL